MIAICAWECLKDLASQVSAWVSRRAKHLDALKNPQSHKGNAFASHTAEYHQGEEQEVQYTMEVVGH